MLFKNKYLKLYSVFFLVISLLFGQLSFAPKGSSSKTLIMENNGAVNVPQKLIVNGVNYAHAPRGVIVIWRGSIASIPVGWALCNGSNGTPDLRDRFIVGAGGPGYAVGDALGEAWHSLTVAELPSHTHECGWGGAHTHIYVDQYPCAPSGGSNYKIENNEQFDSIKSTTKTTAVAGGDKHTHVLAATGSGVGHENRPPYYALAFIMKL